MWTFLPVCLRHRSLTFPYIHFPSSVYTIIVLNTFLHTLRISWKYYNFYFKKTQEVKQNILYLTLSLFIHCSFSMFCESFFFYFLPVNKSSISCSFRISLLTTNSLSFPSSQNGLIFPPYSWRIFPLNTGFWLKSYFLSTHGRCGATFIWTSWFLKRKFAVIWIDFLSRRWGVAFLLLLPRFLLCLGFQTFNYDVSWHGFH